MTMSLRYVIEVLFPVGVRWYAGQSDEEEPGELNTTSDFAMAARFDTRMEAGAELIRLHAHHPDRPMRVEVSAG